MAGVCGGSAVHQQRPPCRGIAMALLCISSTCEAATLQGSGTCEGACHS